MTRGGRLLVAAAGVALTSGCATSPNLQVRAIPDPAAKLRFGGGLLSDGRAQLALGNAGTALETFRKLLREQPTNPDAFAGIAACYQAMGRYDLEQANYEFALAYAPHDQNLLRALASSLERQGQADAAAKIYAEAALDAAPAPAEPGASEVTPVNVPRLAVLTVALPAAAPVTPKPITPTMVKASAVPVLVRAPIAPMAVNAAAMPVAVDAPVAPMAVNSIKLPMFVDAPLAPVAVSSVAVPGFVNATFAPVAPTPPTIPVAVSAAAMPVVVNPAVAAVAVQAADLFPIVNGRRAPKLVMPAVLRSHVSVPAYAGDETPPVAAALPQRPAQPQPAERKPERQVIAQEAIEPVRGPYLERLSTGEVALVTTSAPLWRPRAAPRVAVASVQWVPLNRAIGRPSIQILNAARSQGLAAFTREALLDRGWRKMAIGDARETRKRSLVLYSEPHKTLAFRLAAQLKCKAAKIEGRARVLVLLGRDAALRRTTSSRA
jgi:hypothetical protein